MVIVIVVSDAASTALCIRVCGGGCYALSGCASVRHGKMLVVIGHRLVPFPSHSPHSTTSLPFLSLKPSRRDIAMTRAKFPGSSPLANCQIFCFGRYPNANMVHALLGSLLPVFWNKRLSAASPVFFADKPILHRWSKSDTFLAWANGLCRCHIPQEIATSKYLIHR